jgi:hypothetical protein
MKNRGRARTDRVRIVRPNPSGAPGGISIAPGAIPAIRAREGRSRSPSEVGWELRGHA